MLLSIFVFLDNSVFRDKDYHKDELSRERENYRG